MKTVVKNYFSEVIPEVIMIFLNLILLKLFYSKLGTEVYALHQLFSQFFAYLLLAEAGFSSAALVSLYKPIANNDYDDINRKLSGIRYIFNIIGLILILLGIVISFVIPFFIKDNNFSTLYIQVTFILFLISNSLNYFFFTYRILYDANQKKYVSNLIYQIGSIIKYIVEIVLLVLGIKLGGLLFACIICNLFVNLFMRAYALKNNSFIKFNKDKDLSMLKGTKDLFIHKVSGVIANNIDIVLISKNLGLTHVAQYSAYNYILNEVTKVISKIGGSLYSAIGIRHFGENNSNEKNNFIQLNSFMFFLASIICSSLVFSYNSFISLFYGKEMVVDNFVSFLFIFLIYFQIIRIPLNTYVNGCGLFKETKVCTIVEGIINLVLSIIGIKYFGMVGVLLATIISYLVADFIVKPIVIKNQLNLFTLKQFFVEDFKNSLCLLFLIIVNLYFFNLKVKSLVVWFLVSMCLFGLNTMIALGYFKLIKRNEWFFKILNVFRR